MSLCDEGVSRVLGYDAVGEVMWWVALGSFCRRSAAVSIWVEGFDCVG